MRLIDADALAERAMEDFFGAKIIPLGCLYTAPTVDAVPVVRCKDCKYHSIYITGNGGCDNFGVMRNADDFCSYGERKEE